MHPVMDFSTFDQLVVSAAVLTGVFFCAAFSRNLDNFYLAATALLALAALAGIGFAASGFQDGGGSFVLVALQWVMSGFVVFVAFFGALNAYNKGSGAAALLAYLGIMGLLIAVRMSVGIAIGLDYSVFFTNILWWVTSALFVLALVIGYRSYRILSAE